MLLCDFIIFWARHFERPTMREIMLERANLSPKYLRSQMKRRKLRKRRK